MFTPGNPLYPAYLVLKEDGRWMEEASEANIPRVGSLKQFWAPTETTLEAGLNAQLP